MNTQLYNLYLKYPQVITDSREAGKGKLFLRSKGIDLTETSLPIKHLKPVVNVPLLMTLQS